MNSKHSNRPLEGVRVLEIGQLLAGPFTGTILGYFGAEVIKVESPNKGDPIRGWREVFEGTSYWWASLARNKKCITLDLSKEEGRKIFRQLTDQSDVLVENFKPGTMEKWGLGWEDLRSINPKLVMVRVTGFGQTGPYKNRPGFGTIAEAFSGFASMTGEAFCDAASSIFDILQRNFLLAYGTYAFPSMILQIMSIVLAMVAAAGSFAVTYGMFEIQEEVMATGYALVCALITGFVVWCSLSYFTMILVNTTDAVFVCYAKDKDRNEIHHEEMHSVFENAVRRRQEARGEIVRQPAGPYAYGAGNPVANKSY